MLICKICGYTHETMISPSHLKMHNITGKEYKEKYPGSILRIQTETSKAKMSKSKRGLNPWNKGVSCSNEQKNKISETQKRKFKSGEIIHWNTGLKHSEETKKKISEKCKEYRLTPEQKKKQSIAICRYINSPNYKNAMKGKKFTKEQKENLSRAMINARDKIRKTMEENGIWTPIEKLPEFVKYKREIWKLTNKNVHLIPNYDASKRGRCSLKEQTYQVDHNYSILEGFIDGVPVEIIAHPANLSFVPWQENLKKWHKSSISLKELKIKIKSFNKHQINQKGEL